MSPGRLNLFLPYLLVGVVVAIIVVANLPRSASPHAAPTATASTCLSCGMTVDPATAPRAQIEDTTYCFCGPGCEASFVARLEAADSRAAPVGDRPVDVVCHMEVNPAWGIASRHDGQTFYFCTPRCRERFDADPTGFLATKCPVCNTPLRGQETFPSTYLGKTYAMCSAAHRTAFQRDPASYFMHTMWGIPTWLYYGSIAAVLVVSFGLLDRLSRRTGTPAAPTSHRMRTRISGDAIRGAGERLLDRAAGTRTPARALALPILAAPIAALADAAANVRSPTDRFDLLSVRWIRTAVRSRPFRFVLQAMVVALFVVIVVAGLFGNQNPALNIAPILTWTIWWGLLIVLIMFAGKAWCYVCPWDALAGWTEKLSFFKKRNEGLSLNLRWPRAVRNIAIATILFVGLTWVELGFGVTMKPRVTAYLAVAMLLMAVLSALLFDRKSFCRYGCLVGRVSGLYALFAGVEVRTRHTGTCRRCRTKECVRGSETAYGCPTFLYPGKLKSNTYCIQCMECVQACPHDNLAVNLRPWGSDLVAEGRPRTDEAYLALLMLAITGFHGLTMTPAWQQAIDAVRHWAGVGRVLGFSIGMAFLMIAPVAVYALLVAISKKLGGSVAPRPLTYRDYFIRYAYALLPIALFYHVAHNLEHLLMEGPKVVAMASDPFGWGWNLFGTASWTIPPLISLDKLWLLQVLLVLIGHVYSLWVAQQTSLRLFGSPRAALRSQLPMLGGMICFSVFSLWLLKQPMEMRTSAM